MKLKVYKPQKSGEQISDEEAGTVNAAADNAVLLHRSRAGQNRTAHSRMTIVQGHEWMQMTMICPGVEQMQHIEKAADMRSSHGTSSI